MLTGYPGRRTSPVFMRMLMAVALGAWLQTIVRADDAAPSGSISDPNILYVGRWGAADKGVRKGYWSGVI